MAAAVGQRIGLISIGGENLTPKIAVLNSIADVEIIAAPSSSRQIAVLSATITATATTTFALRTGGALGNALYRARITSASVVTLPPGPVPWFVCRAGEDLFFDGDGLANVYGTFWYVTPLAGYLNTV